jgi:hypothetical protein
LIAGNIACEREKKEPPYTTNSPPSITSLSVIPENPRKENELSLIVQADDPNRDIISYTYQWLKNDTEIPGEDKRSLKTKDVRRGDIIQVRVTPSDGKEDGKSVLSAGVKIRNSSPVIQEVGIEPKIGYANDSLKAYVKGFDADGDSVSFIYQWERNGTVLSEEKAEAIEKNRFKKGDSITVTVTPNDGDGLGIAKKSAPVIIANSPPMIVSSPPTAIDGTTYSYQVKANDADSDSMTFALKSSPKGMEIDSKMGLIRWEVTNKDKGNHPVEIEVSDPEGAKSFQRFTLTVDTKSL